MGPVAAALEACCHCIVFDLGGHEVLVHTSSPVTLKTRAASGSTLCVDGGANVVG
jgi:enoyl-[acyl-carrier-protein] reductase (NADH)